ncbi:MAG: sigma-70 family RNA polymerase sigma factor [Myxococcaceae bacterium]|nr:sigma-70 family RNA polymerase sigma factor [Myxococcaceae bacterium]
MTQQVDDSGLVARARQKDAAAFTALVRRHLRAAIAVGIAVLKDATEAEDLAQDAFTVAYQNLAQCRDPAHFGAWLLSIVRSRALNRLAQKRIRAPHDMVLAEPTTAKEAERFALREQLLQSLAQLTEVQREVVLLHDLEAYSHAEIAAALNMSEVSSRQHLFNARKILRQLLEPKGRP